MEPVILQTTELKMLLLATLLGITQLVLASGAATKIRGLKWNMSARDKNAAPLDGVAARLDRAFKNFLETFPIFIAAVVVVQLLSRNSSLTVLGSQMYLFARLVYVPIYAFGVPMLRTLVWTISMVGIALLLFACF